MSDFDTMVTESLNFDPTVIVKEDGDEEEKELMHLVTEEGPPHESRKQDPIQGRGLDIRPNNKENCKQKGEIKIEFLTPKRPFTKLMKYEQTTGCKYKCRRHVRSLLPYLGCLLIYLLSSFDKMCVFICAALGVRFFANNITLRS